MIGGNKKKYYYRKAEKGSSDCCMNCWRFNPYFRVYDRYGNDAGWMPKCSLMGMTNNITEKVRADHVCDLVSR